ncbi:hypothetical protein ACWEV3_34205 [Saccharopolyspora sp. NPDC003752]
MTLSIADPDTPVVVWWVIDHDSDVRHATLTDPTKLADGTPVAKLCDGELALAKPGTRPKPRSTSYEDFCDPCASTSSARAHGPLRSDRFYY